MNRLLLILGNQLFPKHIIDTVKATHIHMAESMDLVKHGMPHKQKVFTFLCAMRQYAESLKKGGYELRYSRIDREPVHHSYFSSLDQSIDALGLSEVHHFDVADHFFFKELQKWAKKRKVNLIAHPNPMFLTERSEFQHYLSGVKRPFMKSFYESQRKRLKVLMLSSGKPEGGQYSFDSENRKKLPKDYSPSPYFKVSSGSSKQSRDVVEYIESYLGDHPGSLAELYWPTTRKEALAALDHFVSYQLPLFGDYQDAIDSRYDFLNHSLLSSSLNMGLLLPAEVIERVSAAQVPLNSKEGFIRQVIGWREFVRGIYDAFPRRLFESNHWDHHRRLGPCWYDGSTGLPPLDDAIKKALRTGYNHHIERLMIVANLMNLCEIKPQNAYDWFMSFYVDSSDWVMAANVFGMGLMSDGGIFATKPYISGSNYILKMSSYKKGPWCDVWNALYWRFVEKHKDRLNQNPRMGMILRQLDKKTADDRSIMRSLSQDFIDRVTVN